MVNMPLTVGYVFVVYGMSGINEEVLILGPFEG